MATVKRSELVQKLAAELRLGGMAPKAALAVARLHAREWDLVVIDGETGEEGVWIPDDAGELERA